MQDSIAKQIYIKITPMPDSIAQEILDFIDFLAQKYQFQFQDMHLAQLSSLEKIWDNTEDDVWNNIKTY